LLLKLNKGQKEAYKKCDTVLSTELKKLLKYNGVSEYPIFFDEETNTLFAFQKFSLDGGFQDLATIEIVKIVGFHGRYYGGQSRQFACFDFSGGSFLF